MPLSDLGRGGATIQPYNQQKQFRAFRWNVYLDFV